MFEHRFRTDKCGLQGHGGDLLVLARLGWVAVTLLALTLFIASLPPYFAYVQRLNVSGVSDSQFVPVDQLTPVSLHALQMLGLSLNFYAWYQIILRIIVLLVFTLAGGIIFWKTWRSPTNRVALLASFFLVLFPSTFFHTTLSMILPAWIVLDQSVFFLGSICLGLFFMLFPAGQFVPRWTRWLLVGWVAYWAVDIFFPAPNSFSSLRDIMYNLILFVLLLAGIGSLVWVQVYRYRQVSTAVERQQTKWVVFGTAVSLGGYLFGSVALVGFLAQFSRSSSPLYYLGGLLGYTLLNVLFCLFPLFLAVAILRARLWDIDIIINRTLVYTILTASVIGLYILLVVSLGALFQARGNFLISLVATGVIAVLFQPLRELLQHTVNRLMYGERDDPYRVISRLGQRLEATVAPDTVLPTIVETVAQALKLPYTALTLKYGDEFSLVASHGVTKGELVHLPLIYQREHVGELILAPRSPGESFTPADCKLLDDLARQAGVVVHAVRLTQDLQRLTQDLQHARERLVSAREEERRRLRRDLHDGLGPQLSSQTLLLTSAQMLLRQDPDEAEAILKSAITLSQQAISDIRRLVYALRPPSLDDLGLLTAIGEQLTQYRASGIIFSLEAPEQLPSMPAAVEVACYRIVQEALTNVVRHAHAHTCVVRLVCREQLTIDVTDDGLGLPPAYRCGVGLNSMRERAEELGGNWHIEPGLRGGTRLYAVLPYR